MMKASEKARQQFAVTQSRRRADRDLSPASKEFTASKAIEAAADRIAARYAEVLKNYRDDKLKVPENA